MRASETFRQMDMAVAAPPRIDLRFNRRGRRGENHRDFRNRPANNRHVARMIVCAVFLLVCGIVLFIDDDQSEIGIRQKKRRTCADHYSHFVCSDRRPGACALAL